MRSTIVPVGTWRLAPVTNIRAKWRTVAVRSASGPTMNPGVSHRNRIGSSNASHSCMNRAALSAPWASIAPPRWVRVVGDHAERLAVDAGERGDHPEAEAAAQLEHVVEQRVDHRSGRRRCACGWSGSGRAARVWSLGGAGSVGAAEVRQVALGGCDRLGVVARPAGRRRRWRTGRRSGPTSLGS